MTDGYGEEDYMGVARNTMSQNDYCAVKQRSGSPNLSIQHDDNNNNISNGYPSTNVWSNSSR